MPRHRKIYGITWFRSFFKMKYIKKKNGNKKLFSENIVIGKILLYIWPRVCGYLKKWYRLFR
eukprot:UN09937